MDKLNAVVVNTPVGDLGLVECDGQLVRLDWQGTRLGEVTETLKNAATQVLSYFAGTLRDFDLPLAPRGSAFQRQVYAAMQAIPYGSTQTYGELAQQIDGFAQAVGQACGSNPLPLIIPCHRVLARGGLGGYSGHGGIETKIVLLQHEGAYPFLL